MELWKYFHDMEFTRWFETSAPRTRSPPCIALVLNPLQYALLNEKKSAVTRSLGLTELLMEENGLAYLYGSDESVSGAYTAIMKMFSENGIGNAEGKPASSSLPSRGNNPLLNIKSVSHSYESSDDSRIFDKGLQHLHIRNSDLNRSVNINSQPSTSGGERFTIQSCSLNPMTNECLHIPSPMFDSLPWTSAKSSDWRHICSRFFVKISDAPRLIRLLGEHKKRIEYVTGCTINLLTNKNENDKFPIEVFSTSLEQCEIAYRYIVKMLAVQY